MMKESRHEFNTGYFDRETRQMRALLRLAYIQQRWGTIDLDVAPDDPDAKQRREIVLTDLDVVGLLPERLREETDQIYRDYCQSGWNEVL